MKKSTATKAPKKSEQPIVDLAPKKQQDVNGGFHFVATVSKASPK